MTNQPGIPTPAATAPGGPDLDRIGLWLIFAAFVVREVIMLAWMAVDLLAGMPYEDFETYLMMRQVVFLIPMLGAAAGMLMLALGAARKRIGATPAAWVGFAGYSGLVLTSLVGLLLRYPHLEPLHYLDYVLGAAAGIGLFLFLALTARARGAGGVAIVAFIAVGLEGFWIPLQIALDVASGSLPGWTWSAVSVFGHLSVIYLAVVVLVSLLGRVTSDAARAPRAATAAPASAPLPGGPAGAAPLPGGPADPEVKRVLDLRLARGEISAEEYHTLVQTVGGPAAVGAPAGASPPLNRHLYFWMILSSVILSLVLGVSALGYFIASLPYFSSGEEEVILALLLLLFVVSVPGIVFWLILLYKAWKALQPFGARTTPGQAVGFLFIPFFNLYWQFVAYRGLALDFNRIADQRAGAYAPRINPGIPLTMCILSCCSWLPYIGMLAAMAGGVLFLIFVWQVARGVSALAGR